MNNTLPTFKQMKWKVYRSIRRGVKIGDKDILVENTFQDVDIGKESLIDYREYLDFKTDFPFSYLYILAQRAQIAVMLDPLFTIGLPGMIHLSNHLEQIEQVDIDQTIEIHVKGEVQSKEEGSLHPQFEVTFSQNQNKVAFCKSGYLAKRKRKSKSPKSSKQMEIFDFSEPTFSDEWLFTKSFAKEYAKISGDKNPIHTSKIFAKFAGFRQPIIHGWYTVNRVLQTAEKQGLIIKVVDVNFVKPIFLPSTVMLELSTLEQETQYRVISNNGDVLHLYGILK